MPLRRCRDIAKRPQGARIAAAATLLALMLNAGQHARAAEPVTPISLSCDGTIMDIVSSQPGQTHPIKIGLASTLPKAPCPGLTSSCTSTVLMTLPFPSVAKLFLEEIRPLWATSTV
jgi:hypothetical protein